MPSVEPRGGWRRLLRASRPQATRANAVSAVLALLLGFVLTTQVRQTRTEGLNSLRQSDLVRVLDDVNQRSTRLENEARELQTSSDRLAGGSGGGVALAAERQRLDTLRILSGTVAAHGPGIRLAIDDPAHTVTAAVLLDALEELRDAGAEAVQLGPVRVVASSYLADVPATAAGPAASAGPKPRSVSVDGVVLESPYVFRAIGDAQTLASAMQIPGGLTQTVRQLGAVPVVTQVAMLDVDALHALRQPRYAQRVPSSASGQ